MPERNNDLEDNALRQAAPSLAHPMPTDKCRICPDLAAVVDAWPTLPASIRIGILAIVRAASADGPGS